MKKLLLILFILPFAAFAQTPQTSYVVPTVSAMKSYYGAANRIYVVEKNSDYVQCITCTPDEVNIYAGAGGRKWMKFSDSAKADVSALADSAQAIRSDFPSVTGVTQAQLDDTAQAIRSDFPSGGGSYHLPYNGTSTDYLGGDTVFHALPTIPLQFNPIAGTNMTLGGTYPNIIFNSTGSGGNDSAHVSIDSVPGHPNWLLFIKSNRAIPPDTAKYGGGSGSVTTISDLNPLFTVTNRTSTPTFNLSNAPANTVFTNSTGSSAAPAYGKLSIATINATGSPSASTFLAGDGSWKSGLLSQWSTNANGTDVYLGSSFNNVAIGRPNPQARFEIHTANITSLDLSNGFILSDTTASTLASNKFAPPIGFKTTFWSTLASASQNADLSMSWEGTSGGATLYFRSNINGTSKDAMALLSNGNVTFGGDVKATGNLSGVALSLTGYIVTARTISTSTSTPISIYADKSTFNAAGISGTRIDYTEFDFNPTVTNTAAMDIKAFRGTIGESYLGTSGTGGLTIGSSTKNWALAFDVQSTSQGIAPPRMTTSQKNKMYSWFSGTLAGGSGYLNTTYQIALTGGSGSGAVATVVVSGGAVTSFTLVNPGKGYVVGDVLSGSVNNGTGWSYTITSLTPPPAGTTVFVTDATSDKSTTGVEQTWDGTTWQNKW